MSILNKWQFDKRYRFDGDVSAHFSKTQGHQIRIGNTSAKTKSEIVPQAAEIYTFSDDPEQSDGKDVKCHDSNGGLGSAEKPPFRVLTGRALEIQRFHMPSCGGKFVSSVIWDGGVVLGQYLSTLFVLHDAIRRAIRQLVIDYQGGVGRGSNSDAWFTRILSSNGGAAGDKHEFLGQALHGDDSRTLAATATGIRAAQARKFLKAILLRGEADEFGLAVGDDKEGWSQETVLCMLLHEWLFPARCAQSPNAGAFFEGVPRDALDASSSRKKRHEALTCLVAELFEKETFLSDSSRAVEMGPPIALELGGGLGLTSVCLAVAAAELHIKHAPRIFCTEKTDALCELIKANARQNGIAVGSPKDVASRGKQPSPSLPSDTKNKGRHSVSSVADFQTAVFDWDQDFPLEEFTEFRSARTSRMTVCHSSVPLSGDHGSDKTCQSADSISVKLGKTIGNDQIGEASTRASSLEIPHSRVFGNDGNDSGDRMWTDPLEKEKSSCDRTTNPQETGNYNSTSHNGTPVFVFGADVMWCENLVHKFFEGIAKLSKGEAPIVMPGTKVLVAHSNRHVDLDELIAEVASSKAGLHVLSHRPSFEVESELNEIVRAWNESFERDDFKGEEPNYSTSNDAGCGRYMESCVAEGPIRDERRSSTERSPSNIGSGVGIQRERELTQHIFEATQSAVRDVSRVQPNEIFSNHVATSPTGRLRLFEGHPMVSIWIFEKK